LKPSKESNEPKDDPIKSFLGNLGMPEGLAEHLAGKVHDTVQSMNLEGKIYEDLKADFEMHLKEGDLGYTVGVGEGTFAIRSEGGCPPSQAVMGVVVARMLIQEYVDELKEQKASRAGIQAAINGVHTYAQEVVSVILERKGEQDGKAQKG
jgi:hypothetical protein